MTETINYLRRCADNKVLEASLTPEMCSEIVQMHDHLEAERARLERSAEAGEPSTEQLPDGLGIAVEMIGEYVEGVVISFRNPVTGELAHHAKIDQRNGATAIAAIRAEHAQRVALQQRIAELGAERDAALAELELARDVLREARDAVEGRTAHLYRGDCPSPRNWLDRDPECPACATLIRIDAYLAAKGE